MRFSRHARQYPSIQAAKARRLLWVRDLPGLHSKLLSHANRQTHIENDVRVLPIRCQYYNYVLKFCLFVVAFLLSPGIRCTWLCRIFKGSIPSAFALHALSTSVASNKDPTQMPVPCPHHFYITCTWRWAQIWISCIMIGLTVWSHLNVDIYISECDFPGGLCAWIIIKQGL